jgi:hypothetical protein
VQQYAPKTYNNIIGYFRLKSIRTVPPEFTASKIHLSLVKKLLLATVPKSEVKRYVIELHLYVFFLKKFT